MKSIIFILAMVSLLLSSCISIDTNNKNLNNNLSSSSEEIKNELDIKESIVINVKDNTETKKYDYFNSYDSEIEKEVLNAISKSNSLQDELSKINKIANDYSKVSSNANTQSEINFSSIWSYTVWDKELNNLWDRISKIADKNTKRQLLDIQRNWIAMKEEVILENIGNPEDSGSIYTLLKNNLLSEITSNRCYILANEFAKIKHENFKMPERPIYGTFVDNQGTNSVYSSLITHKNIENDDEAIISIYRLGRTEGTFISSGNENLTYTSYDENVKGIIKIENWEKATFKVTESKDSPFTVGEIFTFDFAF